MIKNEQAIRKATAHLQMIHGLANDLNGVYGAAPTLELLRLYSETFNHITLKLLPALGMTEEEIEDLCAGIGENYDEYLFKPSIVAV